MRDKGVSGPKGRLKKRLSWFWWSAAIMLAVELYLLWALDLLTGEETLYILRFGLLLSLFAWAGMLVHMFLHELGHLLFGLATGYEFVSFRVFDWILARRDGRLFWSRYRMEGTGGQCLMAPSSRFAAEKHPVVLYNLGGPLVNLLATGIAVAAWLASSREMWASAAGLGFAVTGLQAGLLNAIPLKIRGLANDGYNLRAICQSEAARACFIHQLQINRALTEGVEFERMPRAWFETPEPADWSNVMIAATGYVQTARMLAEGEVGKARAHVDWMLEHAGGLVYIHRMELRAEQLFLALPGQEGASKPDVDAWRGLRTEDLEGFLRQNAYALTRKRQLYALARLADDDPEQAQKHRDAFEAIAKRPTHPGEVPLERSLMDRVDALYALRQRAQA